jgi:xanthine dehydrogenase accessory factor
MGLYEIIDNYLEQKKNGVIATVIIRAGSTPRDVGAKMFVGEDGKLYGTIGGGRMEHDTYQRAMSIMGKGVTEVLHIRMNADEIASGGMICGGNVDVLLEPVLERYKNLYKRLDYMEDSEKKGVLITRFDRENFTKTLIEDDMTTIGDTVSEHDRKTYSGYLRESKPYAEEGLVVEPLQTFSVLYVFGAGHVSQYIAKIASMVDFSVVVIDDRKSLQTGEGSLMPMKLSLRIFIQFSVN